MCLKISVSAEIQITKQNIEVWKIVETCDQRNRHFKSICKSPFLGFKYKYEKKYGSYLYKNTLHKVFMGFHSFTSKRDAIFYVNNNTWWSKYLYGCDIKRCTIPAGSKFIKGTFDAHDSIASDAIIVHKD